MYETYEVYFKFYKDFFERATGLNYDSYIIDNYFSSMDVSKEYLRDITGIKITTSDNHEIFCIPKTNIGNKLYDLILEIIPCKYKLLSKTRETYIDRGVTTFYREHNRRNYI